MGKKTNLFYAWGIWEVLRFVLLFSLISLLTNPRGTILYTLHFLWLNAPLLVLPLLSFLAAHQPGTIPLIRPVLIFGKTVSLIPGTIINLVYFILPALFLEKSYRWGIGVPLTVGMIDFLFLLFLLFYPKSQET